MNLKINTGARNYGYIIWNKKRESEIESLLSGRTKVKVSLNGFDLGEKNIDRKFYRISLGYKFTRALPSNHDMFKICLKNDVLEVISFDGNE